jgi:general secretion pathway protein L
MPADTSKSLIMSTPGRVRGWLGEKLEPVQRTLQFTTLWAAHRRIHIRMDGPDYSLIDYAGRNSWSRRRATKILARGTWDEIVRKAAKELSTADRAMTAVEIIVPDNKCLQLQKLVTSETKHKASQILRLEFDRVTPFQWDDVYADYFLVPSNEAGSQHSHIASLIAIKTSIIAPLAYDLKAAGLRFAAVSVEDGRGRQLPVNLLQSSPLRAPTLLGRLNGFAWITAMAACAAGLIFVTATLWRKSAELDDIATVLKKTQSQAILVRKTLSAREARQVLLIGPRLRKASDLTVLQVWEDLTAAIPGGAWLSGIKIDGSDIQIDGLARAASELISILANASQYSGVEFMTPVIRDPQNGFERFQIRMKAAGRQSTLTAQTDASQAVPGGK